MLKTRVITALSLLFGLLAALFFLPPLGWAWLLAVLSAVVGWEWGALMRLSRQRCYALGGALFILCALLIVGYPAALGGDGWSEAHAWQLGRWFYIPALIFWVIVLPAWLRYRWPMAHPVLGLAVGAVVVLPTLLAFVQLRQLGPWMLIAILALVWAADIAAYFAGRAFGKRKLAPSISPGKTWAGAVGAVLGVLVYGFAVATVWPTPLLPQGTHLALLLVALTVLSIVGDLFESLLKRQAGLKDSSNILPGHGGLLDRIDSQTSTLPLVTLLWLYPSV
jgi:phosphatidate cytidylyltransferase